MNGLGGLHKPPQGMVAAEPHAWPHDGDFRPARTALVIIDTVKMQGCVFGAVAGSSSVLMAMEGV